MDVSAVMAAVNIIYTRRLRTSTCRASTRHTVMAMVTVTAVVTMDMAAAGATADLEDITAATTSAGTMVVITAVIIDAMFL